MESAGSAGAESTPTDVEPLRLLPSTSTSLGSRPVAEPVRRRKRSLRQAQKTEARRDAILLRAVEAFARNGYAKTTLHGVAETVGLTRTGLLNHFPSKDGLFLATLEASERWASRRGAPGVAARGLAGLRTLTGFLGTAEDRMWILFVQMLQGEALHDDAPQQVREFVDRRTTQITGYVRERLWEAQVDGELGDVSMDALAIATTATINGLQMHWLLHPDADVRAALEEFVDGLGGRVAR